MFGRILVPLDGSATAEAILPHVRRLARAEGAELVLLQALPPSGIDGGAAFEPAATAYLAGVESRLSSWGFRVRSLLRIGGAAETITAAAEEVRASLLALATHGRTGAARLLLGSVAEQVLRSAPAPVLAVRPFWSYEVLPRGGVEAQPVRTILVPVGDGPLPDVAAREAMHLGRLFGARLLVLHAGRDEGAALAAVDRFHRAGFEAAPLVQPGDPVDALVKACEERGVDLAVLWTHGRRGLARLREGSVTEDVLRRVRVPLLVVRDEPAG